MRLLKASTAYNLVVFMTDSSDHISGKTGLTLTITASKDGGAFASISPTVTELANGWYTVALTSSHTDTVGDLALHVTSTGADPTDVAMQVRARTTDEILPTASYTAPLDAAGVRAAVGLASANLDTQLSTIDTVADGIKAVTDALPDAGALTSLATAAALDTVDNYLDTEVAAILAAVDTEIASIKAKTDNLPEGITKNAALTNFEFYMVDSADHVSGKTGLTVTAERSIDGGAFAACANAPAEVGSGVYKIDLDAADLNGNVITLKFTSTGADATVVTIKTEA